MPANNISWIQIISVANLSRDCKTQSKDGTQQVCKTNINLPNVSSQPDYQSSLGLKSSNCSHQLSILAFWYHVSQEIWRCYTHTIILKAVYVLPLVLTIQKPESLCIGHLHRGINADEINILGSSKPQQLNIATLVPKVKTVILNKNWKLRKSSSCPNPKQKSREDSDPS